MTALRVAIVTTIVPKGVSPSSNGNAVQKAGAEVDCGPREGNKMARKQNGKECKRSLDSMENFPLKPDS